MKALGTARARMVAAAALAAVWVVGAAVPTPAAPPPAPESGTFAIPAGKTLEFHFNLLSSEKSPECHEISIGYAMTGPGIDFVSGLGGNAGVECEAQRGSGALGPYPEDRVVDFFLADRDCDGRYYGSGLGENAAADHAFVTWRTVDIADAGPGCADRFLTVTPDKGKGNFSIWNIRVVG